SDENQAKLFSKFFRADNSSTAEIAGTGLGLFIVSHLVDALGGRIWVESEEGVGTTFSFVLPAAGGFDSI
ncbi:MAG: ATP-binding protein, partial [SAR202 cluster bacterium]|nr:ATP-binding protein [SAR202 cluster bacterium]